MIKASSKAKYHFIMLDSCDASILKYLLHPEGEHVWLHRHMPQTRLEWWNADVALSPSDVFEDAKIRNMEYDIEFSLQSFLSNLSRFEPHGIELTQLNRPVPNGLWLPSLPEEKKEHILIQNGMLTQFFLPHASEIAQFSCTDLEHLEKVIEIPQVKSLLLN